MWPFESSSVKLARSHVSKRDKLIEQASQLNRHEDVAEEILSLDIAGLTKGLKGGKWTSTIIVTVYIHAAIKAHKATNCLTEVNFKAALQRAAELDKAFEKNGELVGPLHGLPFSLKDQFDLKGLHTTIGYTEWIKRGPAKEDCGIAQIAQHHGAICICKTNVPQTMMSFECRNALWSRTFNPYNKDHTCGGSSGGESALLASDGAVFGFGSDIGGSLRIPVHYCGIYALKPSSGRTFPVKGSCDVGEGAKHVEVTTGPMTRNSADLQLLHTLFTNTLNPPSDGIITSRDVQRKFGVENRSEVPLRPAWFNPIQAVSESPRKKLRVGYYFCDGVTQTSPACVRAVEMSKAALAAVKDQSGGSPIELVEIDPKVLNASTAIQIFCGVTSSNGYWNLRKHLGKDGIDPSLWLIMFPAMSRLLKGLIYFLARFIFRDRVMTKVLGAIGPKDTNGFFDWMYKMQNFDKEFEKKVFERLNLDCIICPVQAIPAITHSGTTQLSGLATSTILYNMVDVPVAVLPVTRVDPRLDSHKPDSQSYDKYNSTKGFDTCSPMMKTETYKLYDAQRWKGLPVAVQVVAQRNQDELAIGLMKVLDKALGERGFGPGHSTTSFHHLA